MGGKCQRRISPKWYTSPIKHLTNKKTAATLSNSRLPSKMICIAFAECQLFKLWLFTNSPIVSDGYFIHSLTASCTFLHIFCTFRHAFPNHPYVLIMHKMQPLQIHILLFSLFFAIFRFVSINFNMDFFTFSVLLIRGPRIRVPAGAPRPVETARFQPVFALLRA